MGGGEAGGKAKTTPDAGGKSVSEKSQATRAWRNPFEKSKSKQTEFFVREGKDKRMTKNGPDRRGGVTFLLKKMILGNL